jgi:hypothetical protein
MAFNGIPPFAIHSFVTTEREPEMLLCEHEFTVLVFAASRVSAESVNAGYSRVAGMVKWSKSGKKSLMGQIWSSPKPG